MDKIRVNIKKAAAKLAAANYAIALTGAGISTESGIPDFRGANGVWTTNPKAEERANQTFRQFLKNPKEYWEDNLNGHVALGNLSVFKANKGHKSLAKLEEMGLIKCVITQNVDNLHRKAGTKKILEYHGNAFKLRCLSCSARYDLKEFDLKALAKNGQLPPLCKVCNAPLKYDIVDFNEAIPSDVAMQSIAEVEKCDVMLVCGTSCTVYPFASLPHIAKKRASVVLIELNMEKTPLTISGISDIFIQGRTGDVLPEIVRELK